MSTKWIEGFALECDKCTAFEIYEDEEVAQERAVAKDGWVIEKNGDCLCPNCQKD